MAPLTKKRKKEMKNNYAFTTIFFTAILFSLISDTIEVNAPVTLDMLTNLRAKNSYDVSRHPLRAIVSYEGDRLLTTDQVTSIEYKKNNATISSACSVLRSTFDIPISYEGAPQDPSFGSTYTFDYKVQANERLVDALNRLVEATNDQLQWRLLEGRLIMTVVPEEQAETTLIGDRQVQVNIQADTFGDALQQVENAYNQQHTDIPLAVHISNYEVAHKSATQKSGLVLEGNYPLRSIVVKLLNQVDALQAEYFISPTQSVRNNLMRKYYFDNDLFYYSLLFFGFPEQLESDKKFEKELEIGQFNKERFDWSRMQFPEMTKRLSQYFDRIYPEWADQEDGASTAAKE